MGHSILIVEDEVNLGTTLSEYLQTLGHTCFWAPTVQEAKNIFQEQNPQVVLMDIGLPDGDGISLARQWRNQRKDFVLLFLSALNDPETRLEGLELGAEDYITKPFALKEIMIRLERIMEGQKSIATCPDEILIGPLKIWFSRYEVGDKDGAVVALSQKENAILQLLYSKKNEAVKRDTIIETVWGSSSFPSNRTVDNYIVKLRKWCETDPEGHLAIQSVRGVGYKLSIKE